MRVLRSGMPSRSLWKSAPSSASMVDAMTLHMMELMMWMAPFWGGGVAVGACGLEGLAGCVLRKKMPPARLQADASDRYHTSLCMCKYMSLA
jgi:hypothetical protein